MNKTFTKGVAIVIMMVTLYLNSAAQETKPKQYFLNRDYSAQLENYLGTQSLVFEFPGKSANELYSASLEILRGDTDKIELVKNKFIDTYNTRKIADKVPLYYTYMVECKDEKIIIENPFISTRYQEINGNSGEVTNTYFPVSEYIQLMDEFSARDKGKKLKIQRDELRTTLKNDIKAEHAKLVEKLNHVTDSLIHRIKEGRRIDTPDWIPDSYAPTFSLDSVHLKLSNNRNYMVVKNPNKTSDELKNRTQILLNFLDMTFATEYSKEIIGNRYSYYARRNVPDFIVDAYFDGDILNTGQFNPIYNFDNYIKFSVSKYLTTIDKKLKGFLVNFEFEISYAPGLVQISTPVLKDYDNNSKKKIYIESYFNDLYKLLFKYYSTDFEH